MKTTKAYNELTKGNLSLEDVNYKTFEEIMLGWERQLVYHGGTKQAVIESCKKQHQDLVNKKGKENFKKNIEKWLNKNTKMTA